MDDQENELIDYCDQAESNMAWKFWTVALFILAWVMGWFVSRL